MLWKIVEWFKKQPLVVKIVLCVMTIIFLVKLLINIIYKQVDNLAGNTLRAFDLRKMFGLREN